MNDKEYRDTALLNYVRALLDVPVEFLEEEIIRMFLEKKIGIEFIIDDVNSRFERIMCEKMSNNLQ